MQAWKATLRWLAIFFLKGKFACEAIWELEDAQLIFSASDDVILEKKRCKSKSGCQVPLHIAFHNLISSNPQLKENILMYEPIQLEVVHLMLGQHGYKYQMDVGYSKTLCLSQATMGMGFFQDLLSFMDKKCITVKYNQVPTTRRK